ncbi:uncharacterized protein LOC134686159 [Mytilus trossulus]|uniref:uncharacterized protein LOC134686159 n=1 Tax=Mytilus trossulus TaxID=6551 RepID=UPI003004D505
MQRLEKKMDVWEMSISSTLDEIGNIKKETETFVESVQGAQVQEQTRFNNSFRELVERFNTKVNNETSSYGDQIDTLLESLSSKMQVLSIAGQKRESVQKLMQFTIHQEWKRFNLSYDQLVETFKVNFNNTLQELILKQERGNAEMMRNHKSVAFSAYRTSSQVSAIKEIVRFDKVWTNEGNGYDPLTGIFTAPRAGLYHITAVVMSPSAKTLYLRLYLNKVPTAGSHVCGDGHKTGTYDVVFSLQMGDEIYIAESGYNIYSDTGTYITFSGHSVA